MFSEIEITLHLRVRTKEKAERVLGWFRDAFKRDFAITGFGRNPDDPSLFRVDLVTPLGVGSVQEALFETLRICSPIATWWAVNGPHRYEGGRWEFIGLAKGRQVNITGVAAAGFEVSNRGGWKRP